ncbi:MAG: alanine racemase [Limibacillus sp.]|jgi:alanine racemase
MPTTPPITALPGDPALVSGRLTIDLDALAENWRILKGRMGGGDCAAVVKADAYGLGLHKAAPALARAGARVFFVALPEEGLRLRAILDALSLPERQQIFVLGGFLPGNAPAYLETGVHPVLNSLEQVERWSKLAAEREERLPAVLHIDSGINRLGLGPDELERLIQRSDLLGPIDLRYIMTHLACADDPEDPMNAFQHERFKAALAQLPPCPASFANSCGLFLGPHALFDLGRPGVALYGVNPTPSKPNPMRQVVTLEGKILQVRSIDAGDAVGYGASYRAEGPRRIATVGVGYADGYLRSLSGKGRAVCGGAIAPMTGRVSMDLSAFDVTQAPEEAARAGEWVELIGAEVTLDEIAETAGTIGYEILTDLGRRYQRLYRGG